MADVVLPSAQWAKKRNRHESRVARIRRRAVVPPPRAHRHRCSGTSQARRRRNSSSSGPPARVRELRAASRGGPRLLGISYDRIDREGGVSGRAPTAIKSGIRACFRNVSTATASAFHAVDTTVRRSARRPLPLVLRPAACSRTIHRTQTAGTAISRRRPRRSPSASSRRQATRTVDGARVGSHRRGSATFASRITATFVPNGLRAVHWPGESSANRMTTTPRPRERHAGIQVCAVRIESMKKNARRHRQRHGGARMVPTASRGGGNRSTLRYSETNRAATTPHLLSSVLSRSHKAEESSSSAVLVAEKSNITGSMQARVRADRSAREKGHCGRRVSEGYDKLVIATGSSAMIPPLANARVSRGLQAGRVRVPHARRLRAHQLRRNGAACRRHWRRAPRIGSGPRLRIGAWRRTSSLMPL